MNEREEKKERNDWILLFYDILLQIRFLLNFTPIIKVNHFTISAYVEYYYIILMWNVENINL